MNLAVRKRVPGEPKIIPNGEPKIIFEGRIGAIVNYPVLVDEGAGYVEKMFEKFVRSPGTRIIAVRDNKIYLQKERRLESNDFDWRLPGGKVVDTFAEYKQFLVKQIPEQIILSAALKELKEEANLGAASLQIFKKQVCGATVEWDLYFVVAENVSELPGSSGHTEGEEIKESGWFTFSEVKKMCENTTIAEGRTAAVLIEFLSR
ncbi:MAG: NUDIX domain-containing protein [Candidatus Magasanikbacteria bacterium]|nr:NUDIX domain-containing protein [Candidatus Magasanikbacteria bacterium]